MDLTRSEQVGKGGKRQIGRRFNCNPERAPAE